MKIITLISLYCVASLSLVSCTAEEIETPAGPKKEISADAAEHSGGGATGQIPTTPPKL